VNKRWPWIIATVLLVVAMVFAACESMGWPFLTGPLQNQIQLKTGRILRLQAPGDTVGAPLALHFWGGIRLQSHWLEISAPPWSAAPFLLSATDFDVQLRYSDVWQAYRGQPLEVQALSAGSVTAYLERMADGRTSWQLPASDTVTPLPHVQSMAVHTGQLHYSDVPLAVTMDAQLALNNGVLQADAKGRFRQDPFTLNLLSTGTLPWEQVSAQGTPAAVKLAASVGLARLEFDGTAKDFVHLNGLDGAFRVQGPSLAAIGAPLGLTLPTTLNFQANGRIQRNGAEWTLALQQAQIGASRLYGDFVFDTALKPPRLSGTLKGALLKLVDLAPAVGVTKSPANRAKVLPGRAFDLAALRAMNADVLIAIDQLDANTRLLESVRPLSAHLQLTDGLLTLTDIDARTAQGHLGGTIALDGQSNSARWVAALNWDGVRLQSWIHQQRAAGLPPYVSGQLRGHAVLQGTGRSTAEILATLHGDVGAMVEQGTLSHLLVEAAGLDVAESLGVYLQGDKPLVLNCAMADIGVTAGVLRPRLMVLDTVDSTAWVDGTLSLASEKLDLRLVVAPKDFSLLTLRSPVHVLGSFAQPSIQLEKGPLGAKLGAALLLGVINPFAALLPLLDVGNTQGARDSAARCMASLHSRQVVRLRTE
jgi:uncharacterized protein involved in outer membrane biogenesis